MKKYMSKFCTISSLCLFLSSCDAQTDQISFSYNPTVLCTPTIIDMENGYSEKLFEEKGLDVNYVQLNNGVELTEALAKDKVQILSLVSVSSLINLASQGEDVVILEVASRSPKAFTLYSQGDSINSPKDLVGKTIAGPKNGMLEYLLISYLSSEGFSLDDVNFVNMSVSDACEQLDNKSVDCALLTGKYAYFADQGGFNLVTDGVGNIEAISVIATTREYYEENTEIVNAYLDTMQKSVEYMQKHPNETISVVAKKFNLPEEVVVTLLKQYDYSAEITEEDIIDMIKIKDFMLKQGLIENDIDIQNLIVF